MPLIILKVAAVLMHYSILGVAHKPSQCMGIIQRIDGVLTSTEQLLASKFPADVSAGHNHSCKNIDFEIRTCFMLQLIKTRIEPSQLHYVVWLPGNSGSP